MRHRGAIVPCHKIGLIRKVDAVATTVADRIEQTTVPGPGRIERRAVWRPADKRR
jgi:hypothetical protein